MQLAWESGARGGSDNDGEWSETSVTVLSSLRHEHRRLVRVEGKGKAPESGRVGVLAVRRPPMDRSSSSQSSIALAHRRISATSQPKARQVTHTADDAAEQRSVSFRDKT
jgi:hypothetical protein